jgi:hypothetical protein
VRIIERKPAALWQHQGRLRLIDAEGVVLPAEDLADFAQLPLLVGANAQQQAPAILKLVASQPAIASADGSGDLDRPAPLGHPDEERRDDFASGRARGAGRVDALCRIHRETPLLGRGFVRFDLRIPDKMVVRVPGEAGSREAKPNAVKPRSAPAPTPPPKAAPAAVPTTRNELARSGETPRGDHLMAVAVLNPTQLLKPRAERVIAAIDVGSSKVAALIAMADGENMPRVIGPACAPATV